MSIRIVICTDRRFHACQRDLSKVKTYLSFIIPWVTINKNTTTYEFQSATTIGFPVGANVYYRKSFGFSYEITPSVAWSQPSGKTGTSKTSNLLFDPRSDLPF